MVEIYNLEDQFTITHITICRQALKNVGTTVFSLLGAIATKTCEDIRISFSMFVYQSICIDKWRTAKRILRNLILASFTKVCQHTTVLVEIR
jgi:hypothetical protein